MPAPGVHREAEMLAGTGPGGPITGPVWQTMPDSCPIWSHLRRGSANLCVPYPGYHLRGFSLPHFMGSRQVG